MEGGGQAVLVSRQRLAGARLGAAALVAVHGTGPQ
jgi:hypothetical protein